MRQHRNPRQRLPKLPSPDNRRAALPEPEPLPDVDHLIHVLRDNLRRADAFITTAEEKLEQSWSDEIDDDSEDEDGGILRHRMRVEYLIEAGKHAVRAAGYTSDQLAAELDLHRGRA
jgi:hypothetical protein